MQQNPKRLLIIGISLALGLLSWHFAPSLAARFRSMTDEANEETTEHEDRAARERFFWEQRTYPNGAIPENARERAWAERPLSEVDKALEEAGADSRLAKLYVAQQANMEQWRSVGPQPTSTKNQGNIWGGALSGRVTSIAISPANPNIVLIGRGGLWRSTDGGVNFTPVIDNLTQTYIHSIAFAPSNPNIVYAGLGDITYFKKYADYLGYGVMRSNDAGQTWQRVSDSTLPVGKIEKILVDPTNAERVYAGIPSQQPDAVLDVESDPGIYVSTNGGRTWQQTFNCEITDIAIHPRDPAVLFIATRQVWRNPLTTCVYQSKDRGLTWKLFYTPTVEWRTNSPFVMRLSLSPVEQDRLWVWIAGTNPDTGQVQGQVTNIANTLTDTPTRTSQVIFRGATCSGVTVYEPLDCFFQFDYDPYFAADPFAANTLYYGALHVYKSTDSGATWVLNKEMHVDQHAISFHPTIANTIYFGNDGGLYKSVNGATTFTALNNTLSLTEFYQGYALHPTNANIGFGGTQDNGQQRRFNTWDLLAGGDGGGYVIIPTKTSTAVCKYVGSDSFWRYDNFSNSATKVQSLPSPTFDTDKTRLSFQEPFITDGVTERIYFGSYRLLVSDNNGDTWSAPGGNQDLTNGGTDRISALAVPRTKPKEIIMTGSQQGRVRFSNNFGFGWLDFTAGLPNRFITSISFSPLTASVVYLTFSGFGTGHVYKGVIANNAITWTDISSNLPDIPVNDLLVDPLNPTTLYVATDIGVFRTTVQRGYQQGLNEHWLSFNRGLPNGVWAQSLVAQPEGTIQVTTWGRGVYQLDRPASAACGLTNIRNEAVNGAISLAGCFSNLTAAPLPVKRYSFTGTAGQLVSMSALATAFDAYLILIGPDGTALAQDDDSAGARNPQIPARTGDLFTLPQTGHYVIEVTVSNNPNEGGNFRLQLNGPFTPASVGDGTVETALGGAGEFTYVNRFTPASYPATISSLTITFTSSVSNKIGDPITLRIGNNANGDENIDDTVFIGGAAAAIKDLDKPTDYPFPGGAYTINSGDFVIGVRKAGNMPVDTSSTIQGRSYFSSNGTNFTRYVNVPGAGSGNFPIRADIVTQIGPLAGVSAASFRAESFAPEQIVALFGVNLATRTEVATTAPLPVVLAGTTVSITDSLGVGRNSPLFFVSAGQINFQIPPGTALGPARLAVRSGANNFSFGSLIIGGVAPGLFTANASGTGLPAAVLFRVRNGILTTESITAPIDLGPPGDVTVLVLYGTGIRKRTSLAAVTMKIGGVDVAADFAEAAPGFIGLDQLNTAVLPRNLSGRGLVNLELTIDGKPANLVQVNFK
jgi:uncharacterized protein (TIGR03437 family)